MRMLSQYYQGLDCADPLPYYEPQATVSEYIPSTARSPMPLYDPSARLLPWDDPSICPPSSLFTFRMTKEQYEELHQRITEVSNTLDEPVRLSRLDVLIGMIAQAHTASDPRNPPITKVMHMINVSYIRRLANLAKTLIPSISNAEWVPCTRIRRATASLDA